MSRKVNNAFKQADPFHVFRPSNVNHNLASINHAFKQADPYHVFRPGNLRESIQKSIFRSSTSRGSQPSSNNPPPPVVSQPIGGNGTYNATGAGGPSDSGSIVNPSIPSASSHQKDHQTKTDYLIPGLIVAVIAGYLFLKK